MPTASHSLGRFARVPAGGVHNQHLAAAAGPGLVEVPLTGLSLFYPSLNVQMSVTSLCRPLTNPPSRRTLSEISHRSCGRLELSIE